MLKMALVDMAFSADAPKIAVTASPSARYITIMDIPYIIASLMPLAERTTFPFPLSSLLALFRKKLTVIGIIGHTHGVSKAIRPPRKPRRKVAPNPFPLTFPFRPSTSSTFPARGKGVVTLCTLLGVRCWVLGVGVIRSNSLTSGCASFFF